MPAPARQIIVTDSVTLLTDRAEGAVVVCGSHGGIVAGLFAAAGGVAGVVFNDAAVGKEEAGIAGLRLVEQYGIAAAAVDYRSARIGDGEDSRASGVISFINRWALRPECRLETRPWRRRTEWRPGKARPDERRATPANPSEREPDLPARRMPACVRARLRLCGHVEHGRQRDSRRLSRRDRERKGNQGAGACRLLQRRGRRKGRRGNRGSGTRRLRHPRSDRLSNERTYRRRARHIRERNDLQRECLRGGARRAPRSFGCRSRFPDLRHHPSSARSAGSLNAFRTVHPLPPRTESIVPCTVAEDAQSPCRGSVVHVRLMRNERE